MAMKFSLCDAKNVIKDKMEWYQCQPPPWRDNFVFFGIIQFCDNPYLDFRKPTSFKSQKSDDLLFKLYVKLQMCDDLVSELISVNAWQPS